jgi:hypothetical protein
LVETWGLKALITQNTRQKMEVARRSSMAEKGTDRGSAICTDKKRG